MPVQESESLLPPPDTPDPGRGPGAVPWLDSYTSDAYPTPQNVQISVWAEAGGPSSMSYSRWRMPCMLSGQAIDSSRENLELLVL